MVTPEKAFELGLSFVLRFEGGYVNDPDDPGGATNLGISLRALKGLPLALADTDKNGVIGIDDIKKMTPEQAADIYKKQYWDAAKLDDLVNKGRPRLAIAVFDTAVNMGVTRAKKLTQKAAGTADDGIWGPKTYAAIYRVSDISLTLAMLALRKKHYQYIADVRFSSRKYLKGWLRRVSELEVLVRGINV